MDRYNKEIVGPGDRVSRLAKEICFQSHGNCPAVTIVPRQPGNFRGPVDFVWKKHILESMMAGRMTMGVENDGAGGKPQFFTLMNDPELFRHLGWEIITMDADDFARSGRFPAIICNDMQIKRVTEQNFSLVQATMEGYGDALKQAHLVNTTGETAIMPHSITAFCDTDSDLQFILTWGATCIGLSHPDLLIDGSKITPGLPIVGFAEDGYRCNGGTFFTNLLLRKFGPRAQDIMQNPEAMAFARKLAVPSKSYARTVTRLVGWQDDGSIGTPLANILGIAHITGGGVWHKFGELLPDGIGAHLHRMDPPEVLLQAQEMSWDTDLALSDHQGYGTFHGGCGMLLVTAKKDTDTVIAEAEKDGIRAQVVGETVSSPENRISILSRFKKKGLLHSNNPE